MAEAGIGRVVDNKYEIIAAIGKGGMSNVWLGRDRRLDKLWAVKEIKPNVAGAQGAANRQAIIDEANFMKRLDHTAIPRVVDIIDTGASIFVVMDYVNGSSLAKVMRHELRRRGIDRLKVVYSTDPPVRQASRRDPEAPGDGPAVRPPTGSVAFVPAVAGLVIASEVVKDLIGYR